MLLAVVVEVEPLLLAAMCLHLLGVRVEMELLTLLLVHQ
jgi:hypothetical protein